MTSGGINFANCPKCGARPWPSRPMPYSGPAFKSDLTSLFIRTSAQQQAQVNNHCQDFHEFYLKKYTGRSLK